MTHDYHQGLSGYRPEQILHDGCGECEERAKSDTCGIVQLDTDNFARAWGRAAVWNEAGLPNASNAELPMLRVLWAVQAQLQHFAIPSPGHAAGRAWTS